jgi:hypothetical protein
MPGKPGSHIPLDRYLSCNVELKYMLRKVAVIVILSVAALLLSTYAVTADVSIPATDTTLTINETGAIHVCVLQSVQDNKDGATDYHFDLQKTYRPENVRVYDYETRKPLKFDMKETGDVYGYDVHFDRPYYHGYKFVTEYDCHNRIIYEGNGVYSLGMRPAVDSRMMDRAYTVVLPPKNFSYLGYNVAMDHPVSETETGGYIYIKFRNVSNAGSDYAWELKFGATGIDNEVRKLDSPQYAMPVPSISFIAAIAALLIVAIAARKK